MDCPLRIFPNNFTPSLHAKQVTILSSARLDRSKEEGGHEGIR